MSRPKIHIDATKDRTTIRVGKYITIVVDSEPAASTEPPVPVPAPKHDRVTITSATEPDPEPIAVADLGKPDEASWHWPAGAPSGCHNQQGCTLMRCCTQQCGVFASPEPSPGEKMQDFADSANRVADALHAGPSLGFGPDGPIRAPAELTAAPDDSPI